MNKSVVFFLGIGAGGIIGGVVGFFLAKKKYENLADEEVKSVKDTFSKYFEHDKVKEDKPNHMPAPETSSVVQEEHKDTPIVDYSARYQSTINGYSSPLITGNELNKLPETSVVSGDPANIFIITPKEFNESEYDAVTLFYYKDGVLANDNYEILNAVEITSMIGDQALTLSERMVRMRCTFRITITKLYTKLSSRMITIQMLFRVMHQEMNNLVTRT